LTTKSGRTIRCTGGHRFRAVSGWKTLDELNCGAVIGVPRACGAPNPPRIAASEGRGRVVADSYRAFAITFLAERLRDIDLEALAFSDVLWDPIASIEADGHEMTYDLSVEDLHNFCVNDFITHNSGAIEQEADMVTFLYRDAYYNPESAVEPDLTEFIIAKSRNGPTGTVKLRFLKEHTLFVPYADAGHYAAP
jgi:replicative DNA helicase